MSQSPNRILGEVRSRIERLEGDMRTDDPALRAELGGLMLRLVRLANDGGIDLKEAAAAALARESAC